MNQSPPAMKPWMLDPEASWWAKIQRARTHIAALAALADNFRESQPYTLTPEPGDQPDEVAYRLRIHRDVPVDISTVVGDTVHNLRSALDSLAYALAGASNGAQLTEREKQVTGFPWFVNATDYDRFFGIGVTTGSSCDDGPQRRGSLYSAIARNAMRAAQPFARADIATGSRRERDRLAKEMFMRSAIRRLNQLSNIDKHRRPTVVGVGTWPEMLYWGSNENDDTKLRWAPKPPDNNDILCYLVGRNAANITLHHEFPLVLTDDPMHQPDKDKHYPPQDCQKLLHGFVNEVHSVVAGVLSQYAQELAAAK